MFVNFISKICIISIDTMQSMDYTEINYSTGRRAYRAERDKEEAQAVS